MDFQSLGLRLFQNAAETEPRSARPQSPAASSEQSDFVVHPRRRPRQHLTPRSWRAGPSRGDAVRFVWPLTRRGTSGPFPVWAFASKRLSNTVRSICKRELVFLLRASLGVSAPGHMVNLSGRVRNGQTVFQRDCTTSHPRQPRASMPALHVLSSTWRCHC